MFDKINRLSLKVYSGCNFNCEFCHQMINDKYQPLRLLDFKSLSRFLQSLPYDDLVDVTITGGEITLAEDLFLESLKVLRKIEQMVEVKFDICIITNGSNMDMIYDWIDNRLITPYKTAISWDGIHNSLSRRSNIPDEYYLKEIQRLGKSLYNNDIAIVHSINPETIDYLYESFKYCYDNGCYNVGYYFIHEANYERLLEPFRQQLEKIAQMVVEYSNKGKDIRFYNWQNIYTSRKDKKNFFLCNKLGNNYHIDMYGDIYPCIYFGDHRVLKLGNIREGIDKNRLKAFEDMYLRTPNCDWKNCGCYHCTECPASNFVHNHSLTERFRNICKLQKIENEIFDKYCPMMTNQSLYIPNDVHNHLNYTDLQDCLKCSNDYTGLVSPNYDRVRGW